MTNQPNNDLFSSYSIANTDTEYDAIRDKIKSRQQIMDKQVAASDRQSSLCNRIRSMRNSVKDLSALIDGLEYTNQGLYEYIRLLEYVRYGVWCTVCNVPKNINDQCNRDKAIAHARTVTSNEYAGDSEHTGNNADDSEHTGNNADDSEHTGNNADDSDHTGNNAGDSDTDAIIDLLNRTYKCDVNDNTVLDLMSSQTQLIPLRLSSLTSLPQTIPQTIPQTLPQTIPTANQNFLTTQCNELQSYLTTLTATFKKDMKLVTKKLANLSAKVEEYNSQVGHQDATGCTRATTRLGVCTRAGANDEADDRVDVTGCTRATTRLGVCTRSAVNTTTKSQYLPVQAPIVFTGQSSQLKSINLLQ